MKNLLLTSNYLQIAKLAQIRYVRDVIAGLTLFFFVLVLANNQAVAGTFTSKGNGNWSGGTSTWTISGATTTAPGPGDIVIVQSNHQIIMDMNGSCNFLIFQGTQNANTYLNFNLNSYNLTMQRLEVDADIVGNGKTSNITVNIVGAGKLTSQELMLKGSNNGGKDRNAILNIGGDVSIGSGVYFNGSANTILEIQGGGIFELGGRLDASGQIGTFTVTPTAIVKFIGTTSQVIPYLPDGYGNLVIENGEKVLAGPTKVARLLDLTNGGLNVGSNTLTLGPLASATGASSSNYVKLNPDGKLLIEGIGTGAKTNEVLFPVGTQTSYTPAYIQNTLSAQTFGLSVKDKVYKKGTWGEELKDGVVNKTWEITKYTSGSVNVNLRLGWQQANQLGSFSPVNATIGHFDGGGWTLPASGSYYDAATNTVIRTGITSFSPFAVQDGSINPLPVELISFKAVKQENGIALAWETASEKNNKGYDVQVSADGKNFETMAFVASKNGNANYSQRYEFLDKTNRCGLVYYRLKQTDFDGTVAYYAAKVIDLGRGASDVVMAYPNPFRNQFEVKLNGAAILEITDLTGKVIYHKQVSEGGKTNIMIDLHNQPAGLYLLKTIASGQATLTRLVNE